MRNYWTERASALAEAYFHHARTVHGEVRFELVTRALLEHLPSKPQRIIDVGGGFGREAIMLSRAGHSVVVVDPDPIMLAAARDNLAREDKAVRARVELVSGHGETAASLVGANFDLACCHSVLMYLDDPAPMLSSLVRLVRPSGLISVLSVNPEAIAMRSGLQRRWREAIASMMAGIQIGDQYAPSREHNREDITASLKAAGATVRTWYGVCVFTDHLDEEPERDEFAEICELEWLAGSREPYRGVARCFHLIAERF